jgi:hypothetical protein
MGTLRVEVTLFISRLITLKTKNVSGKSFRGNQDKHFILICFQNIVTFLR